MFLRQSDRLSGLLFFEGDRHRCICREADLLAFDIGNQTQIDKMIMAFMLPFTTVSLCEFDPAAFDAVNGTDMNPVRPDNVHMLLNAIVAHSLLPVLAV